MIMKKHNDLIQTNISKKTDKIIIKFMTNIQKHESDWKKYIIENENNKNIEIFNKNKNFYILKFNKFY